MGRVEAPGFVTDFPRPYDQQAYLLFGLILAAELKRDAIDVSDRSSVNDVVNDLAGPAGLTSRGVAVMNEYASGGFDVLQQRYPGDEPWGLDEFLPRYAVLLDELMEEQGLDMTW